MSANILKGPKAEPSSEEGLGQLLFNNLTKYENRVCQIDGTEDTYETYASVKLRSIRLAIALKEKGIKKGDVISTCSVNTLNTAIPIIAGLFLGTTISNLDGSLSSRHLNHLLKLIEPKIIFLEKASLKLIKESLTGTNIEPEIIIFEESDQFTSFSNLIKPKKDEESFRPIEVNPDETAFVYFSSGSTGLPKSITHSHKTFQVILEEGSHCGWDEGVLHFSSFCFISAMMVLCSSIKIGSFRVFCREPTAEKVFSLIEKHRIRCTLVSPIFSYELTDYKDVKKFDLTSLEVLNPVGAQTASSQIKKLRQIFPKAMVARSYGMTEAGIISGFNPKTDQKEVLSKDNSCGKPLPGFKIKIVDSDTGVILGPNAKGEICVSSPSMMTGYYKTDLQVFEKDNFFKTGDIGYYDDDGFLYVVDRIKEMFIYKNNIIIPTFIEGVLLEHPAIKEVLVFGRPDEINGEAPTACVTLNSGYSLTEEQIHEYLNNLVSDLERLWGGVLFLDSMPKTPSGKLARRDIKNFALEEFSKK